MICEQGRVVAIDQDCAWVETIRRSTCGSCSVRGACGHGLLNQIGASDRHHVRVLPGDEPLSAFRVGDEVEISIPDGLLLRASGIVYLVPLAGLLAGLFAGSAWGGTEPMAAVGAAIGFAAGLLSVRVHAHLHARDPRLQPRLSARVARATEPGVIAPRS